MLDRIKVLPDYLVSKLSKYVDKETTAMVALTSPKFDPETLFMVGVYGEVRFTFTCDPDGQVQFGLSRAGRNNVVTPRQARMFFKYLKLNAKAFPVKPTTTTSGVTHYIVRGPCA